MKTRHLLRQRCGGRTVRSFLIFSSNMLTSLGRTDEALAQHDFRNAKAVLVDDALDLFQHFADLIGVEAFR